MRLVTAFGRFWYDFIVGDDWTVAVAVVVGVLATWAASRAGVPAWPMLPLLVAAVLGTSIWRVWRSRAGG